MKSTANNTRFVENFKEWACSFSGCDGGDLTVLSGLNSDALLQKFGDRIRGVAGF